MDINPDSQEQQVQQNQAMEVEQPVANQFTDDDLLMQQVSKQHQTLQGGVNSVKKSIVKSPNLSNAQQAQIADQKRAQMQQPIQQQQQLPQQDFTNAQRAQIADQKRAQVQANKVNKPVQQQYVQQQQIPQSQMQQQRIQKPVQRQQLQQAQNNNAGLFGSIKNYVSNLFGSSDQGNAAEFEYVHVHQYNDDDDIIQPENFQVKDQQQINIEELVELKIQAQYDYSKLKKSEGQTLPAMVSIITKDIEQFAKNNSTIEAGIDLICVIDKSGSMSGTKIQSVQQSLIQLLDFLSEKDRLCLVLFNSGAQRLTPLKCLTPANKKYFKNAIATIRADGGTNIPMGTSVAFKQIRERKMKNQVTSIFLLSDGQDTGADQRVKEQKSLIEDVVTIHSFGYGNDHDAALMSGICKVGQGSFYYIQDVKLLDEFFADALGRLASALAEKIQIDIKCAPPEPFQKIEIINTFGDMWKQIDKGRFYQINLPQIASDARKDFVFEFALPPYVDQINDEQRAPIILQAFIQFKNTFSKQVYSKQAQLQLKLYNEEEQLADNDPNQDVTREYLRVYATNVIEQARMKCEQSKNEEAEIMLDKLQQNIMTDQKLAKVSAQAISDLTQAKNASKRSNFQQFGKKQMCQMSVNNYQQEGLNAQFDAVGGQMQQIEQGMFQNKKQLKMVQQVQKRKS